MPPVAARGLRGLLAARRQLVQSRTRLSNVTRGMLRQEGTQLPPGKLSTRKGWLELLEQGFEHEHLLHIVAAYREAFLALTQSIRELDEQLALHEKNNPEVQRLQTMPKVGRIASLTFVAAVDDVHRFASSRKLVGYTGLAPTVRQSGQRTEHGSISREGRRELRGVWLQIAHQVARDSSRQTQPLRRWYRRVAAKRGAKTALVALTRRLLVIAYQLLKTETDYDVGRLKKSRAA
jgi:transposase